MKKITFYTIFLFCLCNNKAQGQAAIARIVFEQAEQDFINEEYLSALKNLDEAEKKLGSSNTRILYLRILTQDKLIAKNPLSDFNMIENLRLNCQTYMKAIENDPSLEDKFKEVYLISERIQSYPKTLTIFESEKQKIIDAELKLENDRIAMEKEELERIKKAEEDKLLEDKRLAEERAIRNRWRTRFYLHFGIDQALGMWSKPPNPSGTLSEAFQLQSGYGATRGGSMEWGLSTYFRKLNLFGNEDIKLGWNYGLEISTMTIKKKWQNLGGLFQDYQFTPFIFFALRTGPTLNYKLSSNQQVEFNFALHPGTSSWATFNTPNYYDSIRGNNVSLNSPQPWKIGMRYSLGANYRFKAFRAGFDFIWGSFYYTTKIEITQSGGYQEFETIYSEEVNSKFKTPTLRFFLGFSF